MLNLKVKEENIYTRCGACNTLLINVTRESIENFLPEDLKKCNYPFKRCPNCGKIYWKGEHYLTLKNKLLKLGILEMGTYHIFDHTADLGIEVKASSKEGVFETLGKALFSELIEGEIEENQEDNIKISASSYESLLVKFVNELLYRFEVMEWIFSSFSCILSNHTIKCKCYGEKFDPQKHIQKREIKAATYHDLKFKEEDGIWVARIILDI